MRIKRLLAGVVTGLVLLSSMPVALADMAPPPSPFSDVSSNYAHLDAIVYLKDKGIISGYPDGTFKPDQVVNRAEALKIILGATSEGFMGGEGNPGNFKDVDLNQWYMKYINNAFLRHIVQGYPDGTFKPEQTVNLVENLKMLIKAKELVFADNMVGMDPYPDAPKNQWYAIYLEYAKNRHLVDPVDQWGNIHPAIGMTRGTLAEMIFRLLVIEENHEDAFNTSVVFGAPGLFFTLPQGWVVNKVDESKYNGNVGSGANAYFQVPDPKYHVTLMMGVTYQGNTMSVEGEQLLKTTASGAKIYQAGCDGAIACYTLFDGGQNYYSIGFRPESNQPVPGDVDFWMPDTTVTANDTLNFMSSVAIQ